MSVLMSENRWKRWFAVVPLLAVTLIAWSALSTPSNPTVGAAPAVETKAEPTKVEAINKALAVPVGAPALLPKPYVLTPEYHAQLALKYLTVYVNEKDQRFVRFLSLYAAPEDKLVGWRRVFFWWLHNLSFKPGVFLPIEIPGSEGRLFSIDIRDYGWNAGSFSAVARREPFFREPLVSSEAAILLRQIIAVAQDPKTLHVEAIVRLDWLFRDTIEGLRSPSYYDLLYSRQRFIPTGESITQATLTKQSRKVPYTVTENKVERRQVYDSRFGGYVIQDVTVPVKVTKYKDEVVTVGVQEVTNNSGFVFVDFPKNKADWEQAFGISDVKDFLKRQKVKTEYGAIVAGLVEDGRNGSFVARSNRLVLIQPTPAGVSLESFDVLKATGKRDYIEQAPDIARGKIQFDAQELLASLPNGGQAAFLTDGVGKRVEIAAGEVAIGPDKTFPQVRTPGDCVFCHAPSYGLIPPRSLVKDILDKGVDVKFVNRNRFSDFVGFYLGWEKRIKGHQTHYQILVEATTKLDNFDPLSPAFSGAELSKEFAAWRAWYDGPLSVEQAAREVGVTPAVLKGLAVQLPTARANMIVRDYATPRPAWDEDVFPQIAKVLVAK